MAAIIKNFEDIPEEFSEGLPLPPSPQVSVALCFKKAEDEKTDDGIETVAFDGRKSRSGIMMVKVGDKYTGSAISFDGIWWEKGGKLHGPALRSMGMYVLQCPRCGGVATPGNDIVKAARRAGVNCKNAKDALASYRVCPHCKMNQITGYRYLDIAGPEGEEVFGKETIDKMKKACDTASRPFVLPPVVAVLPDPEMEGSKDDEIPGEFEENVTELIRRAANFKDENGPYPMRICDITAYNSKEDPDPCGFQLVMPELYSGITTFDAVDKGIKVDGIYKVNLQVFLQRLVDGERKKKAGEYASRETGKRRRQPRIVGGM